MRSPAARRVRHLTTTRPDGDFAIPSAPAGPSEALVARRAAVAPGPWTWLRQVHGATTHVVRHPGDHAGAEGDAAVTDVAGAVLSVTTADCVPVVLLADGAVGVAHAGWRGLMAGVVGATATQLAALGRPPTAAVLGPSIRPECYEFGAAELDEVADRWGEQVRGRTRAGAPALDVAAGVRAALAEVGVTDVRDEGLCTACGPGLFSHRARGDRGRLATVAWIEEAP